MTSLHWQTSLQNRQCHALCTLGRTSKCDKVFCDLYVFHRLGCDLFVFGAYRYAHKRLYTVLPKYSKIQVLPGITSCRLVKDNKQAIELNSLLLNNMPKDGYG